MKTNEIETKFTKGEWIITTPVKSYDIPRIVTTAIQDNPNKVPYICDMWGMTTEEGKANAKLIAAAPDLMEACINSLKTFISIGCTTEADIMKELKNAIEKATL